MTVRVITLSLEEFNLLRHIVDVFMNQHPNDIAVVNGDYDLLWHAIVNDSEEKEE